MGLSPTGPCSPCVQARPRDGGGAGAGAFTAHGAPERLSGAEAPRSNHGPGLAGSCPAPPAARRAAAAGGPGRPEEGLRGLQNVMSSLSSGGGLGRKPVASGLQAALGGVLGGAPPCCPRSASLLTKGISGQTGYVTCPGSPSWAVTGWHWNPHLLVPDLRPSPCRQLLSSPQRNPAQAVPSPGVPAKTQGGPALEHGPLCPGRRVPELSGRSPVPGQQEKGAKAQRAGPLPDPRADLGTLDGHTRTGQ